MDSGETLGPDKSDSSDFFTRRRCHLDCGSGDLLLCYVCFSSCEYKFYNIDMAASCAVVIALNKVPCFVLQSPTKNTSSAQSANALTAFVFARRPSDNTTVSQAISFFAPVAS